jgi:putative FmdB family regulatory protein
MPIYEYVCADCGHAFEELVAGRAAPPCPRCAGARAEKRFSTFGVGSGAPEPTSGACGTCGDPRGPGACARD